MLKRPKPTTMSPITAPERKATCRALFKLVVAPWAVRAEALVAVFIPKKPQRALKKPAVKNATGTNGFWTPK